MIPQAMADLISDLIPQEEVLHATMASDSIACVLIRHSMTGEYQTREVSNLNSPPWHDCEVPGGWGFWNTPDTDEKDAWGYYAGAVRDLEDHLAGKVFT